ncbi:ubiquitin carboxyl-terminal hydrolase 36-like isoform X2 [Lethenteron reissneri]|uniref:ubiquitin carboxyl-terminal hydrolase 36-like isoform X2 n=1 Tax=Lethenteron reissneri TaxID=7753 RepID=UPI002AB6A096|nr:ubiquitin carboxyl-terminal hydrolase 36-like isoform X2 [Lethenteron reissneri]
MPGSRARLAEEDDGIPAARITLFAPERLHLKWERNVCEGAGLQNLGNTCFLNATLQCLTYTPPLANYLLLQEHSRTCKRSDFCLMCLMESHVISTFNNSIGIIQPILITRNLTRIAKHLRFGEQEDAHEFLRYMVDAMQLSCLYDHSELDRYTEATTLIYQIFGGYLRSRVECMQCLGTSITYETCLDIALQINNSSDLVEAFREFVKMETLDDYTCGTCCRKVKATKKLTLHRLPNVLTISIKRYSYFGTKISRDITYPEHLDVQPFMSKSPGEPVIYILYSVLVHAGTDCDIGHYYCYNKISDGNWYCMNDSLVRRVDTGVVMNEQAYMLFYIRCPELSAIPADSYRPLGQATAAAAYRAALKKRARPALDTPGPVSGPQLPCHMAKKSEVPKLSDRFNGSNGSGNCNGNGRSSSSIGMANIISNSSNNSTSSSSNGRAVNGIAGKQAVNIKSNGSSSVRQRKRHNWQAASSAAAQAAGMCCGAGAAEAAQPGRLREEPHVPGSALPAETARRAQVGT